MTSSRTTPPRPSCLWKCASTCTAVHLSDVYTQRCTSSRAVFGCVRALRLRAVLAGQLLHHHWPSLMLPASCARASGPCIPLSEVTFGLLSLSEWRPARGLLCAGCGSISEITESMKPEAMVSVLNVLYSAFDVLCHLHDVYKVETVGTVYMIVAGCPHVTDNHAQLLAHLGTCRPPARGCGPV